MSRLRIPSWTGAEKIICVGCFLLILIHLVASFFPHLRLWGINQLHYFPLGFRIAVTAIGLLILVPQVNKGLIEFIKKGGSLLVHLRTITWVYERFSKASRYFKYSLVSLLSLIFFWSLRAKTPLLGDGYLRGGEIQIGKLFSITEPLDFYLHLVVSRLSGLDGYTTYGVLSCIAGALYIFMVLLICDLWSENNKEKLLIFSILATMGSTQLFFGYVESYSFLYVALTGYIFFSLRYLKKGRGLIWPYFLFLLATGFHLSALFVLPSLVYLTFATFAQAEGSEHRGAKLTNALSLVCVIIISGVGVYLLRSYSPQVSSGSILIHPLGSADSSYSFLSLPHILDFLNHQLLISPVGVVLWLAILLFRRWINFRENVVKFLVLMMLGSFAFALIIDPKLGYARDWDLFAFVGLGVTFLGSYLLIGLLRILHQKTSMPIQHELLKDRNEKKGEVDHKPHGVWLSQVTSILIVTSLISTLPYILVNASQERAIARFEDLLKTDKKGAALGYEILACFFRDKGEDERTIRLWEKAISIDPNPRYFATLGNAYIRLKEYDKAIEAYDRSIKMGPQNPGIHRVYRNLSTTLAKVGRYDEAVVQLKRAISLRPQEAEYYDILGNILGKAERFEEALPYFEMVLSLKPDDVSVYKSLGICYFAMGEIEKARGYLERYLKTAPPDFPVIKAIVDSIETQLEGGR